MQSSLLKPLFLVTEGQLDAPIICSLINTGERIVYMIVAGGYQNGSTHSVLNVWR